MLLPFKRTDIEGTVNVDQMWVKWPSTGIRKKTVLAQTTQSIRSFQKDIKRIEDDVHIASKENI